MADINPFRYRGYYYDVETGFYYLQTRYYDPTTRLFINADNYELLATLAETPGQLNMYGYCNNNPIMFTDETGEFVVSAIVAGAIIGALISGGITIAEQICSHGLNFAEWNLSEIIISMVAGAISGAFAGSPIGIWAQVGVNTIISGGQELTKQIIGGKGVDALGVLFSAALGAVSGGFGGNGFGYIAKGAKMHIDSYLLDRSMRAVVSNITWAISKAAVSYKLGEKINNLIQQ